MNNSDTKLITERIRTLHLHAISISLSATINHEYESATSTPSLYFSGKCRTEKREKISLPDGSIETTIIDYYIKQHKDENKRNWISIISYIPPNGELMSDETWFCEIYIDKKTFDYAISAYRRNDITGLSLSINHNLLISENDAHTPLGFPITYYIPPTSGPGLCGAALGTVSALSIREGEKLLTPRFD